METMTEPNRLESTPAPEREPILKRLKGCWDECLRAFSLIKICRFSIGFAFILPALFIWNEQASEVLRCLAEGHADGSATGQYQFLFFFAGLVTFSLYLWYASRVLLYFRYPGSPRETEVTAAIRLWLPRVVGVFPCVAMAVAFWLSSSPYGPDDSPRSILLWYPGFCLVTGSVLFLFYSRRHKWFGREKDRDRLRPATRFPRDLARATKVAVFTIWGLAALLFILFLVAPVTVPRTMGTGAVILFGSATWICMGSILVYYGSRWQVPLLGLSLLCALIFSVWNDNHQIRTLPHKTELPPVLLEKHFESWYSRLKTRFPNQPRHPVFIVTAEGGGIRAAYWTASVLAAIQEQNTNFASHIFGISGVSGGSLGAVVFDGLLACNRPSLLQDAQVILSQDHLSPTIAYMVLPDLFQRFLPVPIRTLDRARALEMAWEAAWLNHCGSDVFERSLPGLWQMRPDLPDLYLNGTSVEYGKRIITSNIRFDEQDFADALSAYEKLDGDLRLSTAAHMSARFTYVSPAGEFPGGDHIVDGGYFENSGAATAKDLADVIAGARKDDLDIYVIQISNNPTVISAQKGTVKRHEFMGESLSPVHTLLHTRSARGRYSELLLTWTEAVKNSFQFKLQAGSVPLPLGWQLSKKAADEMTAQLRTQNTTVSEITALLPP